ncbi:MAG: arylsulfatase, partial [Phycisphaerales bacterium]|nr:arylsulfatase [Phycisphaerales bacterium]
MTPTLVPVILMVFCALGRGQPNVLLILTDDQGFGDLSCRGNPILKTPRIDALESESLSFDRFYVSPVCTPTRAALMTGRLSQRTRAIDTWRGLAIMDPDEVTIAELLHGVGYTTGMFGKWHLGDSHPSRPMDQGFDHVLMHRGGGLGQPSDALGNRRRYTDPILYRDGEEVQTSGYCMDVYVDEAIGFMEQAKREDRPFFAYVATNTPHGPFHDVPEDAYDTFRSLDLHDVSAQREHDDRVARVYAMVDNIDRNVGRLLDALDRMDLADDTLVIYLHDNGPEVGFGRYNAGLRGSKGTVYEGGIRTPCFLRWPGHIEAGATRSEIAQHVDLLPTIAEICGASVPDDRAYDGRSLVPLLTGHDATWPERLLNVHAHRGAERIRRHHFAVIGQRYKVLSTSRFWDSAPTGDLSYELYDLENDPGETTDLASSLPDVLEDLI